MKIKHNKDLLQLFHLKDNSNKIIYEFDANLE